jgi:SAM-dependent methyltransferase
MRSGDLSRSEPAQFYTENYFAELRDGSAQSARQIVPLIVELFHPRSVIDVGCGVGTWLAVFRDHGITKIMGVDGDYINRRQLLIADDEFLPFDLRRPLEVKQQFDLVLCLEVAEHLPADCAASLVGSLVRLAPVVVFSAAVPFQGGVAHINEQWPTYWVERFNAEGYAAVDCLRPKIWENEAVEWYYAQNLLCFTRKDQLNRYSLADNACRHSMLTVVHPRNYLGKVLSRRDSRALVELGNEYYANQEPGKALKVWWEAVQLDRTILNPPLLWLITKSLAGARILRWARRMKRGLTDGYRNRMCGGRV